MRRQRQREVKEFEERVVRVDRTRKTVAGGRISSARVVVAVGDLRGRVGVGVGKARDVPGAIEKGVKAATKAMIRIPLDGYTIPHVIQGKRGGAVIMLKPASRGTGIIEPSTLTRLDGEILERLASEKISDTVKVFNLVKTIAELVRQQGAESPYLIPIGERAEAIAKAFEERLYSAQEAVQQLKTLIKEYQQALRRRQESDLSREGFGVYWLLQSEQLPEAEQVARKVEPTFQAYPHWARDSRQERQVRLALYKALMTTSGGSKMTEIVERILTVLRKAAP